MRSDKNKIDNGLVRKYLVSSELTVVDCSWLFKFKFNAE